MEAVEERTPGMGGGELMGVYLPNVDMPKGDKVLTVQICPDGSIWQQYRGTVPNAKTVPVPPHGRLGDLDALAEYVHQQDDWLSETAIHAFCGILCKTPAIIPAEPLNEEVNE